jgi:hypothetical protein
MHHGLRPVHSADVPGTGYIARAWPLGQSFGIMSKKPRRRRETPTQAAAANDNKPNAKPVVRFAWDVYRAAARARYVGQVIAADADEAIEAAAVDHPFEGGVKTDIKRLIAVRGGGWSLRRGGQHEPA